MSIQRLLLESGDFFLLESEDNILLETSTVTPIIYKWKGAVQPAESGASGLEIRLWKGAVEPAASTLAFTGTDGVARNPRDAMPLDHSSFHTFITAAGGKTGHGLNNEWRDALASALGYTAADGQKKNINDLWKEYYDSL